MRLTRTINYILKHPLNKKHQLSALLRFVKWQFISRICPYPVIVPFAEKSKLILKKGLTGATGNHYCGLHEFEDMAFVLHFLKTDDTFVDVGANVGSYTLLGAVETGAKTISFEPVPATFNILQQNCAINNVTKKVKLYNLALGSKKGTVKFTRTLDTVNHIATSTEQDTVEVPIDTADNALDNENPALVKIDVEGYETEVLAGMQRILDNAGLKAIILELNGSGTRYGYNEDLIHTNLLQQGFKPYSYNPFIRQLTELKNMGI
ncbi:MAG: FkbM family methyltransferase [Chloroflexia bacterium]|nr:FkbM family methyltransferase [Chloroflexia bacterium]